MVCKPQWVNNNSTEWTDAIGPFCYTKKENAGEFKEDYRWTLTG